VGRRATGWYSVAWGEACGALGGKNAVMVPSPGPLHETLRQEPSRQESLTRTIFPVLAPAAKRS